MYVLYDTMQRSVDTFKVFACIIHMRQELAEVGRPVIVLIITRSVDELNFSLLVQLA